MSSTLLLSGLPATDLSWAGPGRVTFIVATNITANASAFSVHDTLPGAIIADATSLVKEMDAPPGTPVFVEFPGDGIPFSLTSSGQGRVLRLTPTVASSINFHVYGVKT